MSYYLKAGRAMSPWKSCSKAINRATSQYARERQREREGIFLLYVLFASTSVPRLWSSGRGEVGFVVAGQELKVVEYQVDDNRHSGDNHTNEVCLQDVMASKCE